MKNLQIREIKKYEGGHLGFVANIDNEYLNYYQCIDGIVAIHISLDGYFWNNTMQVLLDFIHEGHLFRLGLKKYKSRRQLALMSKKLINYAKSVMEIDYEKINKPIF